MKKTLAIVLLHLKSMIKPPDFLIFLKQIFIFIWSISSKSLKQQIIIFVLCLIFASTAEIYTLQALYRFTNQILVIDSSLSSVILRDSYILIALIMFTASVRLFAIRTSTRVTASIGNSISCTLFRSFLNLDYFSQKSTDSSDILTLLTSKTSISIGVFNQFFLLISSALVSCCIFIYLFLSNPITSITIFVIISLSYYAIIFQAKKKLFSNSKFISSTLTKLSNRIKDSYSFDRDIKIYSLETF